MSLIFYSAPMSTASVTYAVLAELGVACERVRLDIDSGDTRAAGFLKINPNGRVPVLVHDGVAIWESSAITIHLGESFGAAAGLYPTPGPARGEALKWIVWASATLGEAAGRMAATLPPGAEGGVQAGSVDFVAPSPANTADLDRARTDLRRCVGILDGALSGRAFLLGTYSLADTHLWVLLGWIGAMGLDMEDFPAVTAWIERCSARPALATVE